MGGHDDRTTTTHGRFATYFFCDAISVDFLQVKMNGFSHFGIVGKSHGGAGRGVGWLGLGGVSGGGGWVGIQP